MSTAKSILTSRTFWIAILQAVIGILVALGTQIPDVGWLLVAKSVLDVVLRVITTQPVAIP